LSKPLKLLLVDDHPIVREGLEAVISQQPGFVVQGTAASAEEALKFISKFHPDLAIVDISLPGKNGILLIKDILKISPDTKIIVYTMHDAESYAERAFKAGASGYVMKEEGASKVVEGIHEAVKGNQFLCPKSPPGRKTKRSKTKAIDPEFLPIQNLSDRQLEVFALVGAGLNSWEIAEKLSLSHKTVNAHKMNLQDRLGIGSARELLIAANRWVDRR
jgi:two-component system response regulator NreC